MMAGNPNIEVTSQKRFLSVGAPSMNTGVTMGDTAGSHNEGSRDDGEP